MLFSHETLLLHANVGPRAGTVDLDRCVQLAAAWQRLGGQATIACGEIPGRLSAKITSQNIEIQPLPPSGGQALTACELAADADANWFLAAGAAAKFLPTELLIESATGNFREPSPYPASMLAIKSPRTFLCANDKTNVRKPISFFGNRYQVSPHDQCQAHSVPSVAKRLLVCVNDLSSDKLHVLVDRLQRVSVARSTIEIVVPAQQRDSRLTVELKRIETRSLVRVVHSLERRLTSNVPIHLAITDDRDCERRLAERGIPVVRFEREDLCQADERWSADGDGSVLSIERAKAGPFCKKVSQLIRSGDRRRALIDSGRNAIDGQAARRIARRLASDTIELFDAHQDDWDLVGRWGRDSESQAVSLSAGVFESRSAFARSVQGSTRQHWIARLSDGTATAMLSLGRSAFDSDRADVSVLVNPALRNQNLGTALLERLVELVFANPSSIGATAPLVQTLSLQASQRNQAARRMAINAGFRPTTPTVVGHQLAHQFELTRAAVTQEHETAATPQRRSA